MNATTSVISVEGLDFGYTSGKPILKQLSLNVPPSSIYGFLGANGAGKSTTIRSILGLLKPQSGAIRLFEKEIRANRLEVLKKVGTLIESPSFYRHLSAYDNLKISCKYLNVPFSRINEVLDLVNLTNHSKRISKEYSTGMKQRLGLAMALLSDPELLILDEPTNGLDPTGIIEFRNILTNLNQMGKTIFLSSHLLSEIERIATQVGIIKNGVMLFQGTIEELEKFRKTSLSINIVSPDVTKAADSLAGRYETKLLGTDSLEIVMDDRENIPKIIEEFVGKGIRLYEVSPQKDDLEKLFINLTTAE